MTFTAEEPDIYGAPNVTEPTILYNYLYAEVLYLYAQLLYLYVQLLSFYMSNYFVVMQSALLECYGTIVCH